MRWLTVAVFVAVGALDRHRRFGRAIFVRAVVHAHFVAAGFGDLEFVARRRVRLRPGVAVARAEVVGQACAGGPCAGELRLRVVEHEAGQRRCGDAMARAVVPVRDCGGGGV